MNPNPERADSDSSGSPSASPAPVDEAAYLANYRLEDWPRPSVAVDLPLLTVVGGSLNAVLVRRTAHPMLGAWALPGGFVGLNEPLEDAVVRVLREKAGMGAVFTTQLATFGDLGRDPRGRVISVAYLGLVDESLLPRERMAGVGAVLGRLEVPPGGGAVRAFAGGEALTLAFDHGAILGSAVAHLRRRIWEAPHAFELVPPEFTIRDLFEVYEAILGERLDKNSFRRRILDRQGPDPGGWPFEAVGRRRDGMRARPAELFWFPAARNRRRIDTYRRTDVALEWPAFAGAVFGGAAFTGAVGETRAGCDPAILADRSVGSLVAGAIGDGLGGPVEGLSREAVEARFGPGGVRDLPPWGARWSDDTQLTAVVAESLLATGGRFAPGDFVPRLVAWLPTGRGVGRTTSQAIAMLGEGEPWDEVGIRLDSSGNGAAMRTAPVGLVHAGDASAAALRSEAILFALPTHAGSIGVAATVAMAAGVGALARAAAAGARRFDSSQFIEFLVGAIADLEPEPTPERRPPGDAVFLRDRLRQIAGWLRRPPHEVFAETWSGAFALESVPGAIYAFLRSPDDAREVLLTAANASHDTDTIASMAGNLVGAWLGAERLRAAIPEWWDAVERRDELEVLGRRLAALACSRP